MRRLVLISSRTSLSPLETPVLVFCPFNLLAWHGEQGRDGVELQAARRGQEKQERHKNKTCQRHSMEGAEANKHKQIHNNK